MSYYRNKCEKRERALSWHTHCDLCSTIPTWQSIISQVSLLAEGICQRKGGNACLSLWYFYCIIKDRKMNDNVLFVMITCCRVQQIQRDISPPCQDPVWCSTGLEMTTISFSVSVSWIYPTAPGLEVLRSTSLNLSTSTWGTSCHRIHSISLEMVEQKMTEKVLDFIDMYSSHYVFHRDILGNCFFLRAEIALKGATHQISFSDTDQLPPPFRIDNISEVSPQRVRIIKYCKALEWFRIFETKE